MLFYDNYINNISQTPKEDIKDLQQAIVDSWWLDGTLNDVIQEETSHGSFEFSDIDVWVNSISEFTVQISKNEKDYRRFMFKDQSHQVERGRLYKYLNSYWIVYDPTDEKEPFAEVYTRRCNNTLKWIDKTNGKVNEFPCVIDYDVGSPSPQKTKAIEIPNGHIVLWVQANDLTKTIKKNQRFIFNGDPYKFTSYNAYLQEDYTTDKDKFVPMLYMDLYLDEVQPSDDLENNIANAGETIYELNILQSDFTAPTGTVGQLSATVTLNGETVSNTVLWESDSDNITITSAGAYTLTGNSGTQGTIKAYLQGNENIYDEINISVGTGLGYSEIVLDKQYDEIAQYETIEFNADVYIDGQKQSTDVTATVNNLGTDYYALTKNNNKFTLTANKISTTPLNITFSGGSTTKTVNIKLKSLF